MCITTFSESCKNVRSATIREIDDRQLDNAYRTNAGHFSSIGRGYFAGLRMTSRRNNVRNVMFFAIFTDQERKKS